MATAFERCSQLLQEGRRAGALVKGSLYLVHSTSGNQIIMTEQDGTLLLELIAIRSGRLTVAWQVKPGGITILRGAGQDEARTHSDLARQLLKYEPLPRLGYYGCVDGHGSYTSIVVVRQVDTVRREVRINMFVEAKLSPPAIIARQQGDLLVLDANAWWDGVRQRTIVPLTEQVSRGKPGATVWLKGGAYRHIFANGRPLAQDGRQRLFLDYQAWLRGRGPTGDEWLSLVGRPVDDLKIDAQSLLRAVH